MRRILLVIFFVAAVLPVNVHMDRSSGMSGHGSLHRWPAVVMAQAQSQSTLTQPVPAAPLRKVPAPKPVMNPAGRTIISPGRAQPQQPAQSQQTVQQPDQSQPVQQVEQPLTYTDTSQAYQDPGGQPEQVNTSAQDASPGASENPSMIQTDMYRRTGGQGRGGAGVQQIQQVPVQQPGMQQQPMPAQQAPVMQQPMPVQQPVQQAPVMQQPGMPGLCAIRLSEDRSSVALLDGSGQEVNHIALGRDRVQKIFKSPDGNWNVLVFKVRQRQEYGAISVNVAQCDPQEAREIRAMPENIEFQGNEMLLAFPGNVVERLSLTHKTGP